VGAFAALAERTERNASLGYFKGKPEAHAARCRIADRRQTVLAEGEYAPGQGRLPGFRVRVSDVARRHDAGRRRSASSSSPTGSTSARWRAKQLADELIAFGEPVAARSATARSSCAPSPPARRSATSPPASPPSRRSARSAIWSKAPWRGAGISRPRAPPRTPRTRSNEPPPMFPRLGIIVPYRDRQPHLDVFIPHMLEFFRSDSLNNEIPCRILIVEQTAGLPFNRGAISNIGFKHLASEVDYVCFHDVDSLPVSADYRWPANPAMLIFHGLNFSPDLIKQLFSCVVLLQNCHFESANGFSNDYWGWGFEDVDLRERLLRCNITPEHRQGHYGKLPHVDLGSFADGTPTPDHLKNQKQYLRQWFRRVGSHWTREPNQSGSWKCEGLNSAAFKEIEPRHSINLNEPVNLIIERVVVALTHQPLPQPDSP
jgi:hypothetical protein